MNKPLSVVYEEFKQELANVINNSGLPPLMIEPVLQNFLSEARLAMQRQYQLDRAEYEKSLEDNG
jgi:preprotein translocase subunit SecB